MTVLGWRRRVAAIVTVGVAAVSAAATPALAQGTSAAAITGVVKDTSGGVLPGVTVEVSSPALIEQTADRGDERTGAVSGHRVAAWRSTP